MTDPAAFHTSAFFGSLPFTVLGVAVLLLLTFAVAVSHKRHSIIDTIWGLGFSVIALISFGLSSGHGDDGRRVLITALTCAWGLRLAVHIGLRQRGAPEDPRYTELMSTATGHPALAALRKVFLLQAAAAWFISLPLQVGVVDGGGLGPLAWLGIVSWAVGFFFESVGDYQLERFKADPSSKGKVMDRGLWRYTRHPNYFGDAAVWWGLFMMCADGGWAWLTILSPLLMTWFLTAKTGKPLMEKQLSSSRPGYADYVARTSGFIPLPPKRSTP